MSETAKEYAPIQFRRTVPILRIFDVAKAREFYLDFLGFKVDWEHRFEPGLPLYMQISRGDLVFHLSEHHGDGTPGAVVFVDMEGLREFHREINAEGYRHLRPDIQRMPWNADMMGVVDPFGNHIRFTEYVTDEVKKPVANAPKRVGKTKTRSRA